MHGKRPAMRFAESRQIHRPASQSQSILPLICGMGVTAIVTLGVNAEPMIATCLGVLAGAVATFAFALAMKRFG